MDGRVSYLKSYLKKTEELLVSLPQTCRTQRRVLDIATKKIQSERTHIECELRQLSSGSGTQNMEVDETVVSCSENKQGRRGISGMATKGKRSHGDMMGADAEFLGNLGCEITMSEEVELMFGRLQIGEENKKSVLEWVKDGMGGASILRAFESMAIIVGKRLSTVTSEIVYLMSYGEKLSEMVMDFERRIQAEGSKEFNMIQRRMNDLLLMVDHHILKHTVGDIIPELHDVIFKEALADLFEKCSDAISKTESLLSLKTLLPSADLAREKLTTVVDELREMDDHLYGIEVGILEWKPVFSAYSSVAQLEMESFVSKVEDSLDLLWDDLKERCPKRSRL